MKIEIVLYTCINSFLVRRLTAVVQEYQRRYLPIDERLVEVRVYLKLWNQILYVSTFLYIIYYF